MIIEDICKYCCYFRPHHYNGIYESEYGYCISEDKEVHEDDTCIYFLFEI